MLIKPVLEKRFKVNLAGEPLHDEKGNLIEEMVDVRHKLDYLLYEQGMEGQIIDGATKGLRLFEIDYDAEPRMLVWAKDKPHAVEVYKNEWNVGQFNGTDPRVTEAEQS